MLTVPAFNALCDSTFGTMAEAAGPLVSTSLLSCVDEAVYAQQSIVDLASKSLACLGEESFICAIEVVALGFLRKMMRHIATALRSVGSGVESTDYVTQLLRYRFDHKVAKVVSLLVREELSAPKPSIAAGLWLFHQEVQSEEQNDAPA